MPVSIPADNKRNAFLLWIAHHDVPALLIIDVISYSWYIWAHNWINDVLNYSTGALMLVVVWAEFKHGRFLCPRCIDEMPGDGAEKAIRRARTLNSLHWVGNRMRAIVYPLMGVNLICAALGKWVNSSFYPVGTTVIYLSVLFFCYTATVHRPLIPWCPQCQGRGYHEESPVVVPPTPVGVIDA